MKKNLEINILCFDERDGRIVNTQKGPRTSISRAHLKKVIKNPEMIGMEIPVYDTERGLER